MGRKQLPIRPDAKHGVFGEELRRMRQLAGLTMPELARAVVCVVATIAQAEAGTRLLRPDLLRRVADACGQDPDLWTQRRANYKAGRWPGQVSLRHPRRAPLPPPGASTGTLRAELAVLKTWAGEPGLESLRSAPNCCSRRIGLSTVADFFRPTNTSVPDPHTVRHVISACLTQRRRITGSARANEQELITRWIEAWQVADRAEVQGGDPAAAVGLGSAKRWSPMPSDAPRATTALADQLRAVVDKQGFSVRQLAYSMHYDPSTVSRILSGRRLPTQRFVDELAIQCALSAAESGVLRRLHQQALEEDGSPAARATLLARELHAAEARIRQLEASAARAEADRLGESA